MSEGREQFSVRRRRIAAHVPHLLFAFAVLWPTTATAQSNGQPATVRKNGAQYYIVPPNSVAPPMSIALNYRIARALSPNVREPVDFSFDCELEPSGYVTSACNLTGYPASPRHPALIYGTLAAGYLPRFPTVPLKEKKKRRVAFVLTYTPATVPEVDLDRGRLIEPGELNYRTQILPSDYPPSALRKGVEADVVSECQVQADLSLICRTIEVQNCTHPELFANVMESATLERKAHEILEDGSSSIGTRHRATIRFRIP